MIYILLEPVYTFIETKGKVYAFIGDTVLLEKYPWLVQIIRYAWIPFFVGYFFQLYGAYMMYKDEKKKGIKYIAYGFICEFIFAFITFFIGVSRGAILVGG